VRVGPFGATQPRRESCDTSGASAISTRAHVRGPGKGRGVLGSWAGIPSPPTGSARVRKLARRMACAPAGLEGGWLGGLCFVEADQVGIHRRPGLGGSACAGMHHLEPQSSKHFGQTNAKKAGILVAECNNGQLTSIKGHQKRVWCRQRLWRLRSRLVLYLILTRASERRTWSRCTARLGRFFWRARQGWLARDGTRPFQLPHPSVTGLLPWRRRKCTLARRRGTDQSHSCGRFRQSRRCLASFGDYPRRP